EFQPGTDTLALRLSGKDAAELKVLVDAVAQAFLEEFGRKDDAEHQARLTQLQERQAELEGALRGKGQALEDPGKNLKTLRDPARYQAVCKDQGLAERALAETKVAEAKAQGWLAALQGEEKRLAGRDVTDADLDRLLADDPGYKELQALRERAGEKI